jgi:hypothetical protein
MRKTVWVFTEGRKTEPDYVRALKQLDHVRESTSIEMEIARDHVVPYPLVQKALAKAGVDDVDEVWCLFDVESPQAHPRLREAIELAEQGGVRVAVSNPCFEVWLLLHDRAVSGNLTTSQAEKHAQDLLGVDGKNIVDPSALIGRRAEAGRRAVRLRAGHQSAGTRFPDDNPSTTVDLFVESVERAATTSG